MDNWFSPEAATAFRWLSLLCVFCLLGPYSTTGRHRSLVFGTWFVLLGFGCLCLGAATVALVLGQPEHVIRPFAWTGLIVTPIFALLFPVLKRTYLEAELRRMTAQDLC